MYPVKFQFKVENSFDERKRYAEKVLKEHPECIPVVIERMFGSNIPEMDTRKFIVPSDINVGQFNWIIRKRVRLSPTAALFSFVSKHRSGMLKCLPNYKEKWVLPQLTATLKETYELYKDDDGFLYVAYAGEDAFGC